MISRPCPLSSPAHPPSVTGAKRSLQHLSASGIGVWHFINENCCTRNTLAVGTGDTGHLKPRARPRNVPVRNAVLIIIDYKFLWLAILSSPSIPTPKIIPHFMLLVFSIQKQRTISNPPQVNTSVTSDSHKHTFYCCKFKTHTHASGKLRSSSSVFLLLPWPPNQQGSMNPVPTSDWDFLGGLRPLLRQAGHWG